MFRIRIWYADFGVVMASRVWRGRRALGLSVRVARLRPGPGAAPKSTFLLFEWRFRMPETARTSHRQWRQEHCANPGTRARRHAPTRPPPKRGGGSLPAHRSTAQRRGPEWVRCHVANFVFVLHATTARFSAGSCVTSGVPIASSFAPGFKPARTIGPSISSCQPGAPRG